MTLYLIGIGLSTKEDISVKGLNIIKNCDKVYLENYTSLLKSSKEELEEFYNKEITQADRNTTEQNDQFIVEEAKNKDIAFLVIGDPFSATTHIQLFKLAKENKVNVKVINNASILTAVGITGLELYKFGKITSIPFDQPDLETPYHVVKENKDLHTLCLLDLKPKENKFMTIKQAIEILENIEERKQESVVDKDTLVIGCARLGSDDFVVKSGKLNEIKQFDFGQPPHCLIIPGKLHFVEEEMVKLWS